MYDMIGTIKHTKVTKRCKNAESVHFSNASSWCQTVWEDDVLRNEIIEIVEQGHSPTCKTSCRKVATNKHKMQLVAEVAV